MLNMAVLAPTPRAMESAATAAYDGFRRNERRAKRKSLNIAAVNARRVPGPMPFGWNHMPGHGCAGGVRFWDSFVRRRDGRATYFL